MNEKVKILFKTKTQYTIQHGAPVFKAFFDSYKVDFTPSALYGNLLIDTGAFQNIIREDFASQCIHSKDYDSKNKKPFYYALDAGKSLRVFMETRPTTKSRFDSMLLQNKIHSVIAPQTVLSGQQSYIVIDYKNHMIAGISGSHEDVRSYISKHYTTSAKQQSKSFALAQTKLLEPADKNLKGRALIINAVVNEQIEPILIHTGLKNSITAIETIKARARLLTTIHHVNGVYQGKGHVLEDIRIGDVDFKHQKFLIGDKKFKADKSLKLKSGVPVMTRLGSEFFADSAVLVIPTRNNPSPLLIGLYK